MAIKISGDTVIDDGAAFTGEYSHGMVPRLSNISVLSTTFNTTGTTLVTGISHRRFAKLSNSNFVYINRTASSVIAQAIFVDGSYAVTFSSVITILASTGSFQTFNVKRLSDTSALIVYGTTTNLYIRVLTISGTTLSAGTEYTVDTSNGRTDACLAKTDSATDPTKFVLAYSIKDGSSFSVLKLRTLTVSGTAVTLNTATTVHTLANTTNNHVFTIADHDTDQITYFPILTSKPVEYSGTWSRDANGKIALTATNLNQINYLADSVQSHYITFAGGSSNPSAGQYAVLTSGITGYIYTTNTSTDSGTFTLSDRNIYSYVTSITGSTIGTFSAGTTIYAHSNYSTVSADLQLLHMEDVDVLDTAGGVATTRAKYYFVYSYAFGSYKTFSGSLAYNCAMGYCTVNNGTGRYGASTNVYTLLGFDDDFVTTYYKDKSLALGTRVDNASISIFARKLAFDPPAFNRDVSDTINSYQTALTAITKDAYGYEDLNYFNYPMKSLGERIIESSISHEIIARTNQTYAPIFPLLDKNRFILIWSDASTGIRVSILSMKL